MIGPEIVSAPFSIETPRPSTSTFPVSKSALSSTVLPRGIVPRRLPLASSFTTPPAAASPFVERRHSGSPAQSGSFRPVAAVALLRFAYSWARPAFPRVEQGGDAAPQSGPLLLPPSWTRSKVKLDR